MLKASVLVVSRTPELLSRLLGSLDEAYSGSRDSIEVIASWNGSPEDEQRIHTRELPFAIVQRVPYHFASNMNGLARLARGEILIFANDDLTTDPGAIDAAIQRLNAQPEVGLVGARLRTSGGALAHAGIHFTSYGSPYHQLERFASATHPANTRERMVPAVTGAFFAMRRTDFLELELAESFHVCGEDMLLSLQTRSILHKQVLYCPAMSGVHDAESTRSQFEEQHGHDDDMTRIRSGWLEMLQRADKDNLLVELRAAQDEAEDLRGCCMELTKHVEESQRQKEEANSLRDKIRLQNELVLSSEAALTKHKLQQSLLESENKRLRSRIQQLENELTRTRNQAV